MQLTCDAIKLLAQNKLDSLVDIISLAMQVENFLPGEFHKV